MFPHSDSKNEWWWSVWFQDHELKIMIHLKYVHTADFQLPHILTEVLETAQHSIAYLGDYFVWTNPSCGWISGSSNEIYKYALTLWCSALTCDQNRDRQVGDVEVSSLHGTSNKEEAHIAPSRGMLADRGTRCPNPRRGICAI